MHNLVSIIVPVYNCESKIERCIKSIQGQTYHNIEVLIIDDGSKDESGKICSEIAEKDDRITVFHKENGGVSSARNFGLEHATGCYVMFVDSDDYLRESYVQSMVDAITTTRADLVISGYTNIGKVEEEHYFKDCLFEKKEEFLEAFPVLYLELFLHAVWNKIFIKEKINHTFRDDISLGEDCLFVFKYLENIEHIQVVSDTGYYYVNDQADSLTAKYRKDGFQLGENIYLSAKKYVGTNKAAYKAVSCVFLNDVFNYVKKSCMNAQLSYEQKQKIIEFVSTSKSFQEAFHYPYCANVKRTILLMLIRVGLRKLALKICLGWK